MLRQAVLGFVALTLLTASGQVRAETPKEKDIVTTAVEAGSFKTLAAALTTADLVETLQGKGPFTVFAPTDAAFAKLPEGTVANLLKPENKQQLADILKFHVVAGRVYSTDLLSAKSAVTLQGSKLYAAMEESGAQVEGANIVAIDIDASNGVIHVIDAVMLPKTGKEKSVGANVHSKPQSVSYICPQSGRVVFRHRR